MAIGNAFQFLKTTGGREARNLKVVLEVINVRKETIRIELMVASGSFNSKMMRKC